MTLVAAAPISWGVSELPEWGYRMPPERVLSEMRELGFPATELGPRGFLPLDPAACRAVLEEHGCAWSEAFSPSSCTTAASTQ